jgi:hypothetical protein
MLDVVAVPPGETARHFELAIGIDLADPVAAVYDWLTPAAVVPVDRGPPPGGPAGWLFDLDVTNVLVTSLHAAANDVIVARLVETCGAATEAALRCPRNPARACLVDERDHVLRDLVLADDAVLLAFAPHEMQRVQIHFS